MEANKQVKSGELLDKSIDMSKVKLNVLKAQINTKINDVFQIEKFVYNELKMEQFISPMKMHIHMSEFLNGLRIKQFLCELWPILLAAEESAAAIPNDSKESKKGEILKEVIQTKHQNRHERSKSSSHSRSRKQGNMVNDGKEPLVPPTTFNSTHKPQGSIVIENNINRKKHDESASLSRSTNSQNSGTEGTTKIEHKQPLVPPKTFASTLKSLGRINMVNGGKKPIVPPTTFGSALKPQGCIDISKVKLDVLKPWISKKITDILQREDNAAVEFVYNKLKQDKMLCPQKLQIRIAGFLNGGKAQKFVCELWPLLLSAQLCESGIPAELKQQHNDENVRIEKDIKHDGFASLSRSINSQNTCAVIGTKPEQKQSLVPTITFGSTLKPKQRISKVNGEKEPLVPRTTFASTLKPQGHTDIEKDIKHRKKHHESASLSRSTNNQNSSTGMSTKPEQKQHLTSSTLSSKKQQPDKENNKNSINIENQSSKQGKSVSKDNQIDKNKSSKRSADCPSQSSDKDRKHSSSSTSHKKSSSKIVSQSRERGSDDGKACGLNDFANICMFSPKKLQQETKAIAQDQRTSTQFPEFLSELCLQTDDFLNLWNEAPDKETILLSDKFVYPNEKNIEKQIDTTLTSPPSFATKPDHKQQKHNIDFDKAVKAEEEIKSARELQSRKRSHSTMINESKKSKNNSSDKDERQLAKKEQTKAKKSSSKRSSDKGSSRKSQAEASKQKSHKKNTNAVDERMLELFGSCSSDEEELRRDKPSSKKPAADSKKNKDHKKSNSEMSKLVFGSMSGDEGERRPHKPSSKKPAAQSKIKEDHKSVTA